MTRLFKQCLIDYQNTNPNSSDELASLRKMIRAITDYDTAHIAYKCATSSLEDYAREELQALSLMAQHAKTFEEHRTAMIHLPFGTELYFKASNKALKKATNATERESIERSIRARARRK